MRTLLLAATLLTLAAACGTANATHTTGITDRQAIGFLNGKVKLPPLTDKKTVPIPVKQRPYAVRIYKTRPYKKPALNLFFAIGAVASHFATAKEQQSYIAAAGLLGRDVFVDRVAADIKNPARMRPYGVTVHQYAVAVVRGIMLGVSG